MPTVSEALDHAWRLQQSGQVGAAEQIYRQVIDSQEDNANAWCFLGIALYDQKRYQESEAAYRRAIEIQPEFPIAHSNLANTLSRLDKIDEAIASCQLALEQKPDYPTPHLNLGAIYVRENRLDEAQESFERVLELAPQDATAMRNLGAIFIQQGRLSEGESHSQRALAVAPGMAEAQRNLAILHLLQGDFARGWAEYEARWRCGDLTLPDYEQPMWNGESIQGRTILLRCEQGLGDTLQFIRYAKLLKKRGARVLAAVQSVLLPILRDVEGVDQWIDSEQPLPEFDVYAPLLSLPRAFDMNLNNVLADVPYLSADPQRVKSWSQRLDGEGLRIAIAWQGSRDHKTDYLRSLPLAALRPLAEIPGVRLISVQKGDGQEQLEDVGFPVAAFDDLDGDGAFLDTAALLTNVDLIVSTDSAIGHLAGALARPTWLALALTPDWRWLLDREDSVWYPQTRLFRQTAIRDWDGVVEQMATALRAHLDGAEPLIARNE